MLLADITKLIEASMKLDERGHNDHAAQVAQIAIACALANIADSLAHIDTTNELLAEILVELRQAPAAPAAAAPVNVRDFLAETLVMTTDDAGKAAYKVKGFPYSEFGVRIWPEILPALEIDPATLRPGPNPLPAGLIVRAKLSDEGKPRKIIGRGDGSVMIETGSPANGHNSHTEPPEPPDEMPF